MLSCVCLCERMGHEEEEELSLLFPQRRKDPNLPNYQHRRKDSCFFFFFSLVQNKSLVSLPFPWVEGRGGCRGWEGQGSQQDPPGVCAGLSPWLRHPLKVQLKRQVKRGSGQKVAQTEA